MTGSLVFDLGVQLGVHDDVIARITDALAQTPVLATVLAVPCNVILLQD
jgi:hypothetical protein